MKPRSCCLVGLVVGLFFTASLALAGSDEVIGSKLVSVEFFTFLPQAEGAYITKIEVTTPGLVTEVMATASDGSSGVIMTLATVSSGMATVTVPEGDHITGFKVVDLSNMIALDVVCDSGSARFLIAPPDENWRFGSFTAPSGSDEGLIGFVAVSDGSWKTLRAVYGSVSSSTTTAFTLAHLTDTHVMAQGSRLPMQGEDDVDRDGRTFSTILSTLRSLVGTVVVVASGDVVNFGADSMVSGQQGTNNYGALTQHLTADFGTGTTNTFYVDSTKTMPIYFAPGNHDRRDWVQSQYTLYNFYDLLLHSAETGDKYVNELGYPDYVLTSEVDSSVGNALIIALDSGGDACRILRLDGYPDLNCLSQPEGEGLTDEQYGWLVTGYTDRQGTHHQGILQQFADRDPKIVFMHHPLVNGTGTDCNNNTYCSGAVEDAADGSITNHRADVMTAFSSYGVDLVLTGHVHQNYAATSNGVRYVQTAAGLEGVYRLVDVNGKLATARQPQRIGTCKTHSLQLGAEVVKRGTQTGVEDVRLTVTNEDDGTVFDTKTTDSTGSVTFADGLTANAHYRITGEFVGSYYATVAAAGSSVDHVDITPICDKQQFWGVSFEVTSADADQDGCVDFTDFTILALTWQKCVGDAGFDWRADFDSNYCVDFTDFTILALQWGGGCSL